ncbi:N-acetyl-gamma-glutamyl-phosphate reductase [Pelagibacteraceae bacterium]|jgi:N-acetyl-gamma-glutamyl-phosphate reductase|nr:N-acetyl-gamma-glutamyl-phosphate reductase [Pelagibacteraceae bacterium]
MSVQKKINIAIVGATGYTGLDLVCLLCKHTRIKIHYLCATKNLGKKISYFDKRIKKNLPRITSVKKIKWDKLDLVFLSLPNGEAQKIIKKLFYKYPKLKFIDLSADFRITNSKEFRKNYNIKHKAKDLIKHSLYTISEFNKNSIHKYRIISNPGCYPTSIQLPLIPLIKKKLISLNNITIDSKSGFSGAGKNLEKKFTHKNLYSSTYAYSTKNHRHICEIDQEILKLTKKKVNFSFNPHLLPTFRGILSSIYVSTNKNYNGNNLRKALIKFYKKSKFIKIHKLDTPLGSGNVLYTNNCEISICQTRIKNKYIIFSALDNLIKGASGQAIQNMNLIFKFPETLGLK